MKLRKLLVCMTMVLLFFAATLNVKVMAADEADDTTEVQKDVTIVSAGIDSIVGEIIDISEVIPLGNAVTEETAVIEENVKETVKTIEKEETEIKKVKASVSKVQTYTKAELRLLSCIIYAESNGESYAGKLGVGIVVMNRVKSSKYPSTVKGVIYQPYQFGPARNGSLKRALAEYDAGKFTSASEKACIKAAKAALSGEKTVTLSGGKKKSFAKYYFFNNVRRSDAYKLGNHYFR